MMEWTLQCLLWITLASSSAYNYQGINYPTFDYSHNDDTYRLIKTQRIDSNRDRSLLSLIRDHDYEARITKRPVQRTNERSIALDSGVQRVQENEKKRVQSRIEDNGHRSENGSYKIVNNNYSFLPTISSRRGGVQDRAGDAVVFPGPTTANSNVPEIPVDCQELGICEHIPNYPQAIVDKIVSKLGKNKELLFHLDQLDEPQISQRIGPGDTDSIELELCNAREAIIKPRAARDVKGNWYFIMNQDVNPIQGYRVEICKNEGRSCANNIATFHTGYSAYCKQKFVQRTMVALDVSKEEIIPDLPFRLPSCCSCVARQSGRG